MLSCSLRDIFNIFRSLSVQAFRECAWLLSKYVEQVEYIKSLLFCPCLDLPKRALFYRSCGLCVKAVVWDELEVLDFWDLFRKELQERSVVVFGENACLTRCGNGIAGLPCGHAVRRHVSFLGGFLDRNARAEPSPLKDIRIEWKSCARLNHRSNSGVKLGKRLAAGRHVVPEPKCVRILCLKGVGVRTVGGKLSQGARGCHRQSCSAAWIPPRSDHVRTLSERCGGAQACKPHPANHDNSESGESLVRVIALECVGHEPCIRAVQGGPARPGQWFR